MRRTCLFFFATLLIVYVGFLLALYWTPHTETGWGRMELHQVYAHFGRVVSLGMIDRVLTDWYMMAPDLEGNVAHYDKIVLDSVLRLSPAFLAWLSLGFCLSAGLDAPQTHPPLGSSNGSEAELAD